MRQSMQHIAIAGVTVVLFTLALGCATPTDVNPTQQWDQAAVTTLSSELVNRVGDAATAANERAVRWHERAGSLDGVYSNKRRQR